MKLYWCRVGPNPIWLVSQVSSLWLSHWGNLEGNVWRCANRENAYEQESRAQGSVSAGPGPPKVVSKPGDLRWRLTTGLSRALSGRPSPWQKFDFPCLSSKTVRQYFHCLSGTLMWEPWKRDTTRGGEGGMGRGLLNKAWVEGSGFGDVRAASA